MPDKQPKVTVSDLLDGDTRSEIAELLTRGDITDATLIYTDSEHQVFRLVSTRSHDLTSLWGLLMLMSEWTHDQWFEANDEETR